MTCGCLGSHMPHCRPINYKGSLTVGSLYWSLVILAVCTYGFACSVQGVLTERKQSQNVVAHHESPEGRKADRATLHDLKDAIIRRNRSAGVGAFSLATQPHIPSSVATVLHARRDHVSIASLEDNCSTNTTPALPLLVPRALLQPWQQEAVDHSGHGRSQRHNLQSLRHLLNARPAVRQRPSTTKYLDALLCKGFSNQVVALLDAVATAYLLNITLLLPKFYSNYDFHSDFQDRTVPFWSSVVVNHDPQSKHAVDMGFFFDVGHFKKALKGHVDIVDELPPWLQGDTTFSRVPAVSPIHPQRPSTLMHYRNYLKDHTVLRIKCTLHTVWWTTKELGALRSLLLKSLLPSPPLKKLLKSAVSLMQQQLGEELSYMGLHLRHEPDWKQYCKDEAKDGLHSFVALIHECYVTPKRVAQILHKRGMFNDFKVIYIASGLVDRNTTLHFEQYGLTVLHRGNTWGAAGKLPAGTCSYRELCAALDYWLMRLSSIFVGNVFSSFSWMLREVEYVHRSRPSQVSQAVYYNKPVSYSAGDVQYIEAYRWTVYPGILHPDWPEVHYDPDESEVEDNNCLSSKCQMELLRRQTEKRMYINTPSCTLKHKTFRDTGHIYVEGVCGRTFVVVSVLLNGEEALRLWANRPMNEQGDFGFSAEIETQPHWHTVELGICTQTKPPSCTETTTLHVSPFIRRYASPDPESVVYFYFARPEYTSGGPEALHQLHQMINKLYSQGKIGVRSVFPNGNPVYKGKYSNFEVAGVEFNPGHVTPRDYVIVPEHMGLSSMWQYAAQTSGFIPFVYIVGQHVDRYTLDTKDKPGFKRLCLSEYFGLQHSCGTKAVLNTPMAAEFYGEATKFRKQNDRWDNKKDIVLYDGDDLGNLDVSKIKVPQGAQLIQLHGVNRQDVVQVFKRSKVYIDSYVTGLERAIFEGILFDVLPLVAYHGPARDKRNFNIPSKWRWAPWNYTQLNEKIQLALQQYDTAIRDFDDFRAYAEAMPEQFERQVLRFFSDDVHVVVCGVPQGGVSRQTVQNLAVMTTLVTFINYPFTTVEIVSDNSMYLKYDTAGVLHALDMAGYYKSFTASNLLAELKRHSSVAHLLQPPESTHRRRYVLLLPFGVTPLHPQYIASILNTARGGDHDVVFGDHDVMLVRWGRYFPAVQHRIKALSEMGFSRKLMKRLLDEAGGSYTEVSNSGASRGTKHCAVDALLFKKRLADRCGCSFMRRIVSHPLWRTAISKMVWDDAMEQWLDVVLQDCQ